MLRLAFDFIITWRETRTRPNAYVCPSHQMIRFQVIKVVVRRTPETGD